MRALKIVGGWVAAIAVVFGMSYMAERPKYHFEEVAKRVGEQLPGSRLVLTAKSGDITSPVSWFWPATTTFNFAMPDATQGRLFYIAALTYGDSSPVAFLIEPDCERRDVDLYDLNEPDSKPAALNYLGDPIVAPNGKTYRLLKYHYAAPKPWVTAFCDTDWTAERNAVFKARQSQ